MGGVGKDIQTITHYITSCKAKTHQKTGDYSMFLMLVEYLQKTHPRTPEHANSAEKGPCEAIVLTTVLCSQM